MTTPSTSSETLAESPRRLEYVHTIGFPARSTSAETNGHEYELPPCDGGLSCEALDLVPPRLLVEGRWRRIIDRRSSWWPRELRNGTTRQLLSTHWSNPISALVFRW